MTIVVIITNNNNNNNEKKSSRLLSSLDCSWTIIQTEYPIVPHPGIAQAQLKLPKSVIGAREEVEHESMYHTSRCSRVLSAARGY